MAVAVIGDVTRVLYPQGRVGPLGEIGFWAQILSVIGDATGGNTTILVDFPQTTDRLGISWAAASLSSNAATSGSGLAAWTYRGPANESLRWHMNFVSLTDPTDAAMFYRDIWRDPRVVFYPVTQRNPTVSVLQPNFLVTSPNTDTVTTTLSVFGYFFPHMMIQQQPTALPRIDVGPRRLAGF